MARVHRQDREPPARPGDRIHRYEVLEEIGHGGMGVVFLAKDLELGREVALKCPWHEYAVEPDHRRRFLREARATSRLSHPNIVSVLDAFQHEGLPWLALELVRGKNLESHLSQKGRLPLREVIRCSEGVAEALRESHRHNLLHRDINPRNILITPEGRAVVTDFGVARHIVDPDISQSASTDPESLTASGAIVGTPRYMSPEQAQGRPLDQRSDLFSLGAVMYEMCTGSPAFSAGESGGLIDAILHREPLPIRKFTYEIPATLERIIRKALAKSADERYQTASDLLVDLRTLRRKLDFEDYSQSHPGELADVTSRQALPARTNRFRNLAGALVGALIVFVIWIVFRSNEYPLPIGHPLQITSSEAWEGDPALSPDGGRIAFTSKRSGNEDIYVVDVRGGTPLRLTNDPASDSDPDWYPDGSAIAFSSTRTGKSAIWKVGQMGGGATLIFEDAAMPDISPDGARIAFVRANEEGVKRIGVATFDDPSDAVILTRDGDGVWEHRDPSWSPDGTQICYSGQDNLWLVPSRGGEPRQLTHEGRLDGSPAWSPSSDFIYFSSERGGALGIWRVAISGEDLERVTMGGRETAPSPGADGKKLAYSTRIAGNNLILFDRITGIETRIPGERDDNMPALAPDGSAVVFNSNRWGGNYDLWVLRLEDGVPVGEPGRLTEQSGRTSHPAFSPDGDWIAYYRILEDNRDIWITAVSGGQPNQITDHPAPDTQPAWSPDGTQLAFLSEGEGGSQVWVVPIDRGKRSGPPRRITSFRSDIKSLAWLPGGNRLAFIADETSGAEIWIVPVDGHESPQHLASDTGAHRIRWDGSTGNLVVIGSQSGGDMILSTISPATGEVIVDGLAVRIGGVGTVPVFDISPDGRVLAFSRGSFRGDIWVLEGENGLY